MLNMLMRYAIPLLVILMLGGYAVHQVVGQPEDKPHHYSYLSQKEFFDEAYIKAASDSPPVKNARAILVNHHLLAKDLIAQAFGAIEDTPGKPVVVLLSPNHFDVGYGQITTTNYDWKTPYGTLEANRKVIARLTGIEGVRIDPRPFSKEHGISGIVPFIKKSLPEATVVPIIFKSTLTKEAVAKFANDLKKRLPPNTVVVTSVDMSHYVAEEEARLQDAQTMSALTHNNLEALWAAEADSPTSLVVTAKLMGGGGGNFHLLKRSSSLLITNLNDPELNTSYITGYWK